MPRIRDLQQYNGALNSGDIYFVVDGQSFARGQKLSGQQVYTMCKGEDGKNIEIRASGGFLQWKQEGTPRWTNLVALNDLKGADGKDVELRKHGNHIQSRLAGGEWTNLVALSDLKGDKGDPAETPNLSFTAVPVDGGGQPTAQVSGVYPNLQVELGLPAGRDAAAPNLTFRTKPLNPDEQPTANVTGNYPNLQIELGLPSGKDAAAPSFTFAAEALPAGEQPKVEMSGSYPNLQLTFKLPRGDRGLQGKPLTVLPNGHYGQWDEAQGKYVDSGVEAAATIAIDAVAVDFTEAVARTQIETGETVPVIFGKIRKWFSDLKGLAFKDKIDYNNDIDNKPNLLTGGDIDSKISSHDLSTTAHSDIRGLITNLMNSALTAAKLKKGKGINIEAQSDGNVKISSTVETQLFVVVSSLPPSGIENRLYLVPKTGGDVQNNFEEYLYTNGRWELVGNVSIDLANYYKKGETNNKITEKVMEHDNDADAHPNMFAHLRNQQLSPDSWQSEGSFFKYNITVNGLKDTSAAWVAPETASEEAWQKAGILMLGATSTNTITIRAKKKPTEVVNIAITYKK